MQRSNIQWTDYTANPIRYRNRETGATEWACVRVSQGCVNCYAEALARRYHRGGPFTAGNMAGLEPFVDERELWQMRRSKAISGKRVFVGDMTDVFGDWVTDEMLDRLFAVFAVRQDVTWQVLTKRPERARAYITARHRFSYVMNHVPEGQVLNGRSRWPLPNVWLGASVEDQRAANTRIRLLLDTPAAVRFLSCEPLLGPVAIQPWLLSVPTIDWVIVGGESGPGARLCNIEWIRSLVWQCQSAQVPVFVKQLGSRPIALDTELWERGTYVPMYVPVKVRHSHGGDPAEWPEDLRVREFPQGGE